MLARSNRSRLPRPRPGSRHDDAIVAGALHLGRGTRAVPQPEFSDMEWFAAYVARNASALNCPRPATISESHLERFALFETGQPIRLVEQGEDIGQLTLALA
jgi:hypothetical protein